MDRERVVGVDLGGTKILAGLVARDGQVEGRREFPTPLESEQALLDGLARVVEDLRTGDVVAVGFGIPSRIDRDSGRAISSTNVPLEGVDFRDLMHDRLGLPVSIDNDANAAAIAEWKAGAGRGTTDMLMLTLGTGVGGGLVLGGRPYRGWTGAGGEVGHIVIEHDGLECPCGGRGHLESYCSGQAADARAREAFGPVADAHRLVRLANEGEPAAIEILDDIGRRLGSGIASLVNALEPELVVVGGGFAAAGELLLAPAREVVRRDVLTPARDRVRIVPAELGTAAGVIGAGLVAFEALG